MRRTIALITGIVVTTALASSPILAAEEPQYSGFLEDYSGLVDKPDSKLITRRIQKFSLHADLADKEVRA